MSKQEARELKRTQELSSSSNSLVPVFDSSWFVELQLKSMSKDQLRNYFGSIGVRSSHRVVFFEVVDSIDGIVGPIPQTNGLREYKIPRGTRVNIYDLIRL